MIIPQDNVYGAVIMAEPLREFTRFIWLMYEGSQATADPPDDLGCESACTCCQSIHPKSPFIIITNLYFTIQW